MAWDGRLHVAARWALYLGRGEATPPHTHLPAKWVIGDDVTVRTRERSRRGGTVLVDPSAPHEVEPGGGEVLLVYLEPGVALSPEATAHLRDAWAARSFDRAKAELSHVEQRIPARVRLAEDVLRRGGDLQSAAARIGLSVGRLSHVVSEAIAAPPARLRAWHRLRLAVRSIADGASATEAAHLAGYADSAHFSRHCRATLAITPTMLRQSALTVDDETPPSPTPRRTPRGR